MCGERTSDSNGTTRKIAAFVALSLHVPRFVGVNLNSTRQQNNSHDSKKLKQVYLSLTASSCHWSPHNLQSFINILTCWPVPFAAFHYLARCPPRWRWSLLSGCTRRISRWRWSAGWRGWRLRGSPAWRCWCPGERGCRSARPRRQAGLRREVKKKQDKRDTKGRVDYWCNKEAKISDEMPREDVRWRFKFTKDQQIYFFFS